MAKMLQQVKLPFGKNVLDLQDGIREVISSFFMGKHKRATVAFKDSGPGTDIVILVNSATKMEEYELDSLVRGFISGVAYQQRKNEDSSLFL